MKEKMIAFLFKRLSGKVTQLREAGADNYEIYDNIVDDIDVYIETLKDIVKEAVLP